MVWLIERAHTLAKAAGAGALAAAYRLRDELAGKRVSLVCSGGNMSMEPLRGAFKGEVEPSTSQRSALFLTEYPL